MTVDEIGFEPAPRGRRSSGGIVVAALVALGVGWVVLNGGGDDSATPGPTPSASGSPSPSESPSEVQQPGIADAGFQLDEVCSPRTAKRTLAVRFTLVNPSPADLLLLRVVPSLPLGGLKPLDTTITYGGCGDEGGPSVAQPRVAAGGSVLVVFTFRLPKGCPQALPVRADVTSRVFDVSGSGQRDEIPVYNDLGDVDFATCS